MRRSIAGAIILVFACLGTGTAVANGDPAVEGKLSPLITTHKEAVTLYLSWTANTSPRVLFWGRPAEYPGDALVDPTAVEAQGPLGELDDSLRDTFLSTVYGDFGRSVGPHGLDRSQSSRIKADVLREQTLVWHLTHPHAFRNSGKFSVGDITAADAALNDAAFRDFGHSKGMHYNLFCSGQAVDPYGRLITAGGHDKTNNAGIAKWMVYTPDGGHKRHLWYGHKEREGSWRHRPAPPVKESWFMDMTTISDERVTFARDESNTDPWHPSDMKFQRWYPGVTMLPNGKALTLSGTDVPTELGPPVVVGNFGFPGNCQARQDLDLDLPAGCFKKRGLFPEVFDPEKDKNIPLYNAQKLLMMFPHMPVVQTGPGKRDWKVLVMGEVNSGETVANPDPPLSGIGNFDPWGYGGKTYLLDVNAAMKDPDRDVPGENHYELIAEAQFSHNNGARALLIKTDKKGQAVYQKFFVAGGGREPGRAGLPTSAIEMIDLQADDPEWTRVGDLYQPDGMGGKMLQGGTELQAVILPTGKIVFIGGVLVEPRGGFGTWQGLSFTYQLFNPYNYETDLMATSNLPCHDHCTAMLLPDATTLKMGSNRTDLDPFRMLEFGRVSQIALDTGVAVGQVWKPPYLFNGHRPKIKHAPLKIDYGKRFNIKVSKKAGKIKKVVIIRLGGASHSLNTDQRLVEMWFKQHKNHLTVKAPAVPGLAIPGYYMLFVVNDKGIPSVAHLAHMDWKGKHRILKDKKGQHHGHKDRKGTNHSYAAAADHD